MRRRKVFAPRTEKQEYQYNYQLGYTVMKLLTKEDEKALAISDLTDLKHEALRTHAFAKVATGLTNIGTTLNNQGAHIVALNNTLGTLDYDVTQDASFYDNKLENAIKSFQLDHDMTPLGYINAKTLWALNDALIHAEFQKNYNTSFVSTDNTEKSDFALKSEQKKAPEPKENESLRFVIPVPSTMNSKASNIHVFKHVFNVSETRAEQILSHILKQKKGNYAEIWEPDFLQFTEKDKDRGFKVFRVTLAFYNRYAKKKIKSQDDHDNGLFPDWDEQMEWFNSLKSGSNEDKKLRLIIFRQTDARFKALTGLKTADPNNKNLVKIYKELLYEEIKNQRGDNPYEITDYRTRERIQNIINSFSDEQRRVFENIMNNRSMDDYYYYNGSYDQTIERYVVAFNSFYHMIDGEHFEGQEAGKQDNYEYLLKVTLERLKALDKTATSRHNGLSTGQRYQYLLKMLADPKRKSKVLITLVRGLNMQEQQQFWSDATVQEKLAKDLRGAHLVQAIAPHTVSYNQKVALLSQKGLFTVPYAQYRELIHFSDNGEALLKDTDKKHQQSKLVNFRDGVLQMATLGATTDAYDHLLDSRNYSLPSQDIFDKEAELGDVLLAWKVQEDEAPNFLHYSKKEKAYDFALKNAGLTKKEFEPQAEDIETEFLAWFQGEAVKQAHVILDTSEQFIYAEFNKLADLGVQDLMVDMEQLRPQFELLSVLHWHYFSGVHYYKDINGNLQAGSSPIGRSMYSDKYHKLRKRLITTLRNRHPLLYDALDGEVYDIHKLYDAYKKDPQAFEADMLQRFEKELGEKQQGIFETRENLRVDNEDVWKLEGVIKYTMELYGILGVGDSFEAMVVSRLQESSGTPFWVYLGLIGLTIVGGPVGAAAVVALAAASAYDVSVQYHDYDVKSDAANAVVKDAHGIQELTDEPSKVWLAIAIIGLALDVVPAFKIMAKLGKVAKIENATDLARFNKQLDELAKAEKLSNKVKLNLKKQADLELKFNKTLKEFNIAATTANMGVNPTALPKFVKLATIAIKQGVTKFDGFLLKLKLNNTIKSIDSLTDDELKVLKEAFEKAKSVKSKVRTLDEIVPNGKIPKNSKKGENPFHKWFNELTPEELDIVLADSKLSESLHSKIRWPGYLHEWYMVAEIKKFKKWNVPMEEIHRIRTKTLELVGTNPKTGEKFAHSIKNTKGKVQSGPGSKTFHIELQEKIVSSNTLEELNKEISNLLKRWEINPELVPPFKTNK